MRSADEPQTKVVSCPNCPVNPEKLDSTKSPSVPFNPIKEIVRKPVSQITRQTNITQNSCQVVFDIPEHHQLSLTELLQQHIVRLVRLQNKEHAFTKQTRVVPAFHITQGPLQGTCLKHECSTRLGAGISLERYVATKLSFTPIGTPIIKGFYTTWKCIRDCDTCIYTEYGSEHRKLIVSIKNEVPSSARLESIVRDVYNEGIMPDNLSRYLGTDFVARLNNLSARAWDTNLPPTSNHVFTCKPDGQRVWWIWTGSIWYISNPRCVRGNTNWIWTSAINEGSPVVLDIEDMGSHTSIFIDSLTDSNGNPSPVSRDISWATREMAKICIKCPELQIQTRQYLNCYEDALNYCSKILYPTDGMVAIRNGSTEILKIKSVKSLELVLREQAWLYTADGDRVLQLPVDICVKYDLESILELRFTARNGKSIEIVDIFQRVDKEKANSTSAVSDIVRSANKVSVRDDSERREALIWCNDLRREIYASASLIQPNKNIIVDLGTGTGQSLDSMPPSDTLSYLLIEPDRERCVSISRRAKLKKILDVGDIPSIIRSLKIRSIDKAVVNCSISDILHSERISEVLFSETKCVTCVFSMQYMIKELHHISSFHRIPTLGCGYVYDNMLESGILLNTSGVEMKALDETRAIVKWGGDTEYIEPITYLRDYAGVGQCSMASRVCPLPNKKVSSAANTICSNIAYIRFS